MRVTVDKSHHEQKHLGDKVLIHLEFRLSACQATKTYAAYERMPSIAFPGCRKMVPGGDED